MNKFVTIILTVLLLWFGVRLVEVERQRYVMVTGLCVPAISVECLATARPRTSMFWDLFYGLTG